MSNSILVEHEINKILKSKILRPTCLNYSTKTQEICVLLIHFKLCVLNSRSMEQQLSQKFCLVSDLVFRSLTTETTDASLTSNNLRGKRINSIDTNFTTVVAWYEVILDPNCCLSRIDWKEECALKPVYAEFYFDRNLGFVRSSDSRLIWYELFLL